MAANSIFFLFKDSLSNTLRYSTPALTFLFTVYCSHTFATEREEKKPSLLRCLFFSFQPLSVTETDGLTVGCLMPKCSQGVEPDCFPTQFWLMIWRRGFHAVPSCTKAQTVSNPKWLRTIFTYKHSWPRSKTCDKHLRISWKGNSQMFPPRCPSDEVSRIHSVLFRVWQNNFCCVYWYIVQPHYLLSDICAVRWPRKVNKMQTPQLKTKSHNGTNANAGVVTNLFA